MDDDFEQLFQKNNKKHLYLSHEYKASIKPGQR